MKQKIMTLLLSALVMATAFGMKTEAAEQKNEIHIQQVIKNEAALAEEGIEVYDYGYCGNTSVQWGLTPDGILLLINEFESSATMPDYNGSTVPWADYIDYIWGVAVYGNVNNIGAGAFRNHNELLYVYVAEGVKKIGDGAFSNCRYLEEVELPGTMGTIGNNAFQNCPDLTVINLPNSITSIGNSAFEGCSRLRDIQLPSGLHVISNALFRNCTSLAAITIPSSVTGIYGEAFANCDSLTTVQIPEKVTGIGTQVFMNCDGLKRVSFPNSIDSLAKGVFKNCPNLETVNFPTKITTIPDEMFYGCRSLASFAIPAQVTAIGAGAFQGCQKLTEMTFPTNVNKIGNNAFTQCYELKNVSVMNAAASFGSQVFSSTNANFMLRCTKNSTTHTYAVRNNHKYILTDSDIVWERFADIAEWEWYKDAVQYVFDKGLMSGAGDYFSPTKNMTRAQLVTTLYRLAGSPEVTDYSACHEFSDVLEGQYYTEPVCWAYNEGITTGSNGMFNTSGNLTRQQLAAFFFRYANAMGYDTTQRGDYSSLLNADQVADYAQESMEWAVGSGLISGSKTTDAAGNTVYDLKPQGNTSRVQLATILQRFCENFVEAE